LRHKVVSHQKDGVLLKGYASEIQPEAPEFELVTEDQQREKIRFESLKALFFVKDFRGNPYNQESKTFSSCSPQWGKMARVELWDHEVIIGKIVKSPGDRDWFYIYPADSRSNNVRILLQTGNIRDLRIGQDELEDLRREIGPYFYS
jgi:hypothetical protein